jgi:hypothetical protein
VSPVPTFSSPPSHVSALPSLLFAGPCPPRGGVQQTRGLHLVVYQCIPPDSHTCRSSSAVRDLAGKIEKAWQVLIAAAKEEEDTARA